jgi:hypothetical protein
MVNQGIDDELKRACEDVISRCSESVCRPIRAWVDRIHEHNASRLTGPSSDPQLPQLAALEWAQQSAAEALDSAFRSVCQSELRANITRLRLYLEDGRTVGVLVEHVKDRVADEYAAFREIIWNMYAGALREGVLDDGALREILKGVCDEENRD